MTEFSFFLLLCVCILLGDKMDAEQRPRKNNGDLLLITKCFSRR